MPLPTDPSGVAAGSRPDDIDESSSSDDSASRTRTTSEAEHVGAALTYQLRWQFTGVVLNTFDGEDEALAEVRWTVNACGLATAEALSMHLLDKDGRLTDLIEGHLLVERAVNKIA